MKGHRRSWKVMEGHGRSWKVMGGHGRSWKVMEGHGRSFPITRLTYKVRKVRCGGWGGVVACRIIVSGKDLP